MDVIRSVDWEYDRGWRPHEILDDAKSLEAKEKVRLWGYLLRWGAHPSLGPPPSKWLKFGEPPDTIGFFSVLMQAEMAVPIAVQLNEPNTLLKFLQ